MANWFDKTVGFFSAKAAFKRSRYRMAAELVRKYEGAGKGRRTKNWRARSSSANAEIEGALKTLRNRARDLVRNNPYATNALQSLSSGVLGHGGMRVQVKVPSAANRETRLSRAWKAWSETPGVADYDEQLNFQGIQKLATRSMIESGEVFIRRHFSRRVETVRASDGQMVRVPPLKLQVLESDYLDVNSVLAQNPDNGNEIVQGVEFDKKGRRVAYHFYKQHPGNAASIGGFRSAFETVRVPAREVIHLYRMDRPGQVRGVTWLAPIMIKMKDFDEYEDAQLVRQKIAACFSVFIRDIDGIDGTVEPEEGEFGEKVEPGLIEILPGGKEIQLAKPPEVENYQEYTSVVLRSMATGMGITYEEMTGDFSNANFSSARMAHLKMHRNFSDWREHVIKPHFLAPVFSWFLNSADAFLDVSTAGAQAVYTSPRREMVDPQKEIQAIKEAVRSGFMTLSEALRMFGFDPDSFFEEKSADDALLDSRGFVVDSDPRQDPNRLRALSQNTAPSEQGQSGD